MDITINTYGWPHVTSKHVSSCRPVYPPSRTQVAPRVTIALVPIGLFCAVMLAPARLYYSVTADTPAMVVVMELVRVAGIGEKGGSMLLLLYELATA